MRNLYESNLEMSHTGDDGTELFPVFYVTGDETRELDELLRFRTTAPAVGDEVVLLDGETLSVGTVVSHLKPGVALAELADDEMVKGFMRGWIEHRTELGEGTDVDLVESLSAYVANNNVVTIAHPDTSDTGHEE